jgi:biotin synthase
MAALGQITESRLAQIVAIASLATQSCKETEVIIVHEPTMLGLCAGANGVYAEAGANPRDTAVETRGHRGMDLNYCREMLYESGFSGLRYGHKMLWF